MNTTICKATNKSPYCLVFGQEPWADSQFADALHNTINNKSEFNAIDNNGNGNNAFDNDDKFDPDDTISDNDIEFDSDDTIGNNENFDNTDDKDECVNNNDESNFISNLSHHCYYTNYMKNEQPDLNYRSPSYYNNSLVDSNT